MCAFESDDSVDNAFYFFSVACCVLRWVLQLGIVNFLGALVMYTALRKPTSKKWLPSDFEHRLAQSIRCEKTWAQLCSFIQVQTNSKTWGAYIVFLNWLNRWPNDFVHHVVRVMCIRGTDCFWFPGTIAVTQMTSSRRITSRIRCKMPCVVQRYCMYSMISSYLTRSLSVLWLAILADNYKFVS